MRFACYLLILSLDVLRDILIFYAYQVEWKSDGEEMSAFRERHGERELENDGVCGPETNCSLCMKMWLAAVTFMKSEV